CASVVPVLLVCARNIERAGTVLRTERPDTRLVVRLIVVPVDGCDELNIPIAWKREFGLS
ncbi:MAG: hypothetical protein ACXWIH_27745, partial [Burkholderiales bacterium]